VRSGDVLTGLIAQLLIALALGLVGFLLGHGVNVNGVIRVAIGRVGQAIGVFVSHGHTIPVIWLRETPPQYLTNQVLKTSVIDVIFMAGDTAIYEGAVTTHLGMPLVRGDLVTVTSGNEDEDDDCLVSANDVIYTVSARDLTWQEGI
jgi:hypothetical protein